MKTSMAMVLALSLSALIATPALADKDKDKDRGGGQGQWQAQGQGQGQGQGRGNSGNKGNNQGNQGNQGNSGVGPGPAGPGNVLILDRDRTTVYSYYRTEYATAGCPPGLAKKNNGCLPPGQAKKMWAIGQPLPTAIVYYPLPGILLSQLSPAPSGYEYVRVANDILLMAIGTRLIAGAIADLSSL